MIYRKHTNNNDSDNDSNGDSNGNSDNNSNSANEETVLRKYIHKINQAY